MNLLTLKKGNKRYDLQINNIKYCIGNDFEEKYNFVNILKEVFLLSKESEYSINNSGQAQVLINDKEIKVKEISFYQINHHYSITNDLKLTAHSLIARYLDPRGGHLDGAAGAREVVAPVDGPERGVEGRFDAVFEGDIPLPGQPGEIVELALVDAVGARADDDSRHAGMRAGLIVKPLQPLQRGVGVGKSLEIDQVALRRTVAVAVEFDPLGDLLPDALRGHAIRRGERSVVTERTPSLADRPVAVGAGEARIDGKFLHPAAEQTAEVPRIGVEPPRIAPRVSHRYKPQSEGL